MRAIFHFRIAIDHSGSFRFFVGMGVAFHISIVVLWLVRCFVVRPGLLMMGIEAPSLHLHWSTHLKYLQ